MDEPGAHRPGEFRFGEDSSHEGVGLLRVGDGDLRGSEWTGTVCAIESPPRHSESSEWRAPWET